MGRAVDAEPVDADMTPTLGRRRWPEVASGGGCGNDRGLWKRYDVAADDVLLELFLSEDDDEDDDFDEDDELSALFAVLSELLLSELLLSELLLSEPLLSELVLLEPLLDARASVRLSVR